MTIVSNLTRLSILSVAVILPQLALAHGIHNIFGVAGRLESVECKGALVLKLSQANKMEQETCAVNQSVAAAQECVKRELAKIADTDRDAVFTLRAVPGQKTFTAKIESDGETKFSSIRLGTHGDTMDDSIVLMFYRQGVEGDDPYMIYIEQGPEATRPSGITFVPVKRRLLPDLAYYFNEGCKLVWSDEGEE